MDFLFSGTNPPPGPKSMPIFETFLPVILLGARPWCALLLLDADMLLLTNEDLLANHFFLGTSATRLREHLLSDLDFPKQKSTPDNVCACAALTISHLTCDAVHSASAIMSGKGEEYGEDGEIGGKESRKGIFERGFEACVHGSKNRKPWTWDLRALNGRSQIAAFQFTDSVRKTASAAPLSMNAQLDHAS